MKRILSLALTLILALSLSIPALAAEESDLPLWQEYGASSQAECVQLWFGGDESAYKAEDALRQERARWEASMADAIAAFDADAYWDSGACWQSTSYLSKEDFMDDWLLENDQEFSACMLDEWLNGQWETYQRALEIKTNRAAMGGVAGQIGVMLDGTYLRFPDAAPEKKDGRTMVPCRPVLEAMGGTVNSENGQVVCTLDGAQLRFQPGSDTASLTAADGAVSTIQMDVPCYYQNGRTYIPVRFLAEAVGCDVLWDSDYQTAVLLRRSAVTAQVDGQFTILNSLFQSLKQDAGKNYKTAVRMDAALTMLDSINGDKTYDMNAKMELLQSGAVVNMTMQMDLSALLQMQDFTQEMSPAEVTVLRSALRNLKVEVIYDGEGGMLYVKLPALSLLTGGAYSDGSWISMPMGTLEELGGGQMATLGAFLYESQLQAASYSYGGLSYYAGSSPVLLYQSIHEASTELAAYLGDACFESSGGYQVLHYGQDEYNAALEAEYGEGAAEWASDFEKLDAELKIARSGNATYRVLVQTKSDYIYDEVILVDASGSISAAKVDMTLLVKLKNQLNLKLRYTADTAVTGETAASAPAAGETVIRSDSSEVLPDVYGPEPAGA